MPKTPNLELKPVVSFRLSYSVMAWLRHAAAERNWSMNEYVARVLDGMREWWALPKMIADVLEADRKAMGLDQYEYIGHLLARRYNEIRDQGGAGFEKKAKERK
jgi:hypothetical protein